MPFYPPRLHNTMEWGGWRRRTGKKKKNREMEEREEEWRRRSKSVELIKGGAIDFGTRIYNS